MSYIDISNKSNSLIKFVILLNVLIYIVKFMS